MKRLLVIVSLFAGFSDSIAQKKVRPDVFYLWDAEWKNVQQVESASYFTRVRFIHDTCWLHDVYRIGGPLVSQEAYKDREGKLPHGRFVYMNSSGYVDSTGYINDGLLDGTWYFYRDSGKVSMTKKYEKGLLISVRNVSDSSSENEKSKNDTVVSIESEFPGKQGSWAKYLTSNMRYPQSAISKRLQGRVVIGFVVDTKGGIEEEFLLKSVEFTLDDEALRLIKQSPKWKPATQNGRLIKSYKAQPIDFRLQ